MEPGEQDQRNLYYELCKCFGKLPSWVVSEMTVERDPRERGQLAMSKDTGRVNKIMTGNCSS